MNLVRIQFWSLVTKAVTTALGVIQSIVIIRLLSPAEYGVMGLVLSIGGVVGVTQHLGIVDGAIREIAVLPREKSREIGRLYWVSHLVRQAVTLPLSLGLVLLAGVIAHRVYDKPEIVLFIQLYAVVLVLQGLQDVMGATLTGLKRFTELYWVQIFTASVNIAIFSYLTWRYSIAGFFWAIIVTTGVMVGILGWYLLRELRGSLALPDWADIRRLSRRVMRVGAYMYVARIFFVVWQRLPLLVLGGVLSATELGFLNVSLTFGSKLTIIAMALSEVNLSWMSSLFMKNQKQFIAVATRNMQRVFIVLAVLTLLLLSFTPEILRYIIGPEYLPAEPIIIVMTLAFLLYALIDIGTSSVFVPADKPFWRAALYGAMTATTALVLGFLFWARPDPFLASLGVLGGAVFSYILMLVVLRRLFSIRVLQGSLNGLLAAALIGSWWLLGGPALIWRASFFVGIVLFAFYQARRENLLPRNLFDVFKKERQQNSEIGIVCFAGAAFDNPTWTNRQQVMSRLRKKYPVLYVEPRVWLFRYVLRNWRRPTSLMHFFWRLVWFEKRLNGLFVVSQWNLIPGSREYSFISQFNHMLNRWHVMLIARYLGFVTRKKSVMWVYDTEAAEYLPDFVGSTVVYDCVDDHAAQAGVDRNPRRVQEEEATILDRADLVTATSQKLVEDKGGDVQLVLNAGDVASFSGARGGALKAVLGEVSGPILGTVGSLDSYKLDVELLCEVAAAHSDWCFVFIGEPAVEGHLALKPLAALSNVRLIGARDRKEVPDYVADFDVCMIPYRANSYNEASFPLKFWEFMATGKPIVVSGLPELKPYEPLISYVSSAEEFAVAVKGALANPLSGSAERQKASEVHSWEHRVAELERLLLAVLTRKDERDA